MAVKSVDMVRKIRDKNYEETKDLSVKEQSKQITPCMRSRGCLTDRQNMRKSDRCSGIIG